ncbi:MAG: DUF3850 domain-containing protein [Patescibacteria group bacterium]
MALIRKKCVPEFFEPTLSGEKKFDLRLNDVDIKEGDVLIQEEWDPVKQAYTGRSITRKVTYARVFRIDQLSWPEEDVRKYGLRVVSLE